MRHLLLLTTAMTAAFAQNQTVTVTNGYGGGTFATGALTDVWADFPGTDRVFDRWTGDIDTLTDPSSAHTQLRVPNRAVTVAATFRNSAAWQIVETKINGIDFHYYVPPNPIGIIFKFHGHGAGAGAMTNNPEHKIFNRDAVALGFGVAALDSANRTDRVWNVAMRPENPDVQNVLAALALLEQRGLITASTPRFAQGNSNGTGFAPVIAEMHRWKGIAMFIAGGNGSVTQNSLIPAMWAIGANDDHESVGQKGIDNAIAQFEFIRAKGVPSWVHINPASQVYPTRFMRIGGITEADSTAIHSALRAAGILNAQNMQPRNPDVSGWQQAVPQQYRGRNSDIEVVLNAAHATHSFFSDVNSKTLGFFRAQLGLAPQISTVTSPNFGSRLAPNSIASVFGSQLHNATNSAAAPELVLGGLRGKIIDSRRQERAMTFYYASPGQVNVVVPEGLAEGLATLVLDGPAGRRVDATTIAKVAAGVYSALGTGSGPAAANVVRVAANGTQTVEPVIAVQGTTVVAAPISLGPAGETVVLLLYGTGIRGASNVTAKIGGVDASVLFSGAQGQYAGLDQINVTIPRSLAGRGIVDVAITADGVAANIVQVNIR